ncbi:hypothetical protein FIBSPDRAFT_881920 [Athelia psychrophila]|uniref:Uncharacterized protein n=1 Tax=Athelia psychrophila TaxID=1759441 RepID=A0A166VX45_9AGAM|nr:hypothetical protein FIBSPDRAFT_881920 [Fibularhizoctonia sp. CBS 109695]
MPPNSPPAPTSGAADLQVVSLMRKLAAFGAEHDTTKVQDPRRLVYGSSRACHQILNSYRVQLSVQIHRAYYYPKQRGHFHCTDKTTPRAIAYVAVESRGEQAPPN